MQHNNENSPQHRILLPKISDIINIREMTGWVGLPTYMYTITGSESSPVAFLGFHMLTVRQSNILVHQVVCIRLKTED